MMAHLFLLFYNVTLITCLNLRVPWDLIFSYLILDFCFTGYIYLCWVTLYGEKLFCLKWLLFLKIVLLCCRSSRPEVFCNKDVLRNFAKFTGKHLCTSLFFDKVAVLRPAILLKKRLWHSCFPVNFAKFLRTPFFIEHLWWLLLMLEPWIKSCVHQTAF